MSPWFTRRRLLAVTALAVLVALVVVGVLGLVRGRAPAPGRAASSGTAGPSDGSAEATVSPAAALSSGDGVSFARAVAATLFDWDTATTAGPTTIVQALTAVGDPGEDLPGLAADLRGWLPTTEQWTQLRTYGTRQRLDVTTARVPDSWAAILAYPANHLVAGTVAVTIDGVRVREGSWFAQTTTSRSPVALTVFALCPPATNDGACRLLRLSGPDTPLR